LAAHLARRNGGAQLLDSTIGGINRLPLVGTSASVRAGSNPSSLVFQNFNTAAAVNALKQQGHRRSDLHSRACAR
jgi:hypothetical protein